MNILIHTDEYYPTSQACSYRMQVFADTFTSLGDKVTVVTSTANLGPSTDEQQLRREKIIYSPAIRMKKKTTIMRMLNNLSFGVSSIFSSFHAGKVDVVITTSPPPLISISGWIISKVKRAKLVYDVRDIWPDVALEMGSFTEDSFYCKTFKSIAAFMYKHADIVTTVSPGKVEKLKNQFSSYFHCKKNRTEDKVWLVENGFDESVRKYDLDHEIIEKYDIDKKFTCVYIGNIGLAQGLGALLDVAANTKHKGVQFLCFGKGAEKEILEKRVREEGLNNVRFCGVVDHDKVLSILTYSKLSFIPLKNNNMKDSVPTKLYEALGLGCPVLLVAEGDSVDIVKEVGLGRYISPSEGKEKLVELFDSIVDNYQLFDEHKENAIEVVQEKYSRQKIAKEFNIRLQNLCS